MSPKTTAPAPRRKKQQRPKLRIWEHPKGSGIKIAETVNRTGGQVFGSSFQVRIPARLVGSKGGKAPRREFHQRRTEEDAQRLAEERYIAAKQHGAGFSSLTPLEQRQALTAWGILKKAGIDFILAAETAVRVLKPEGGDKTVGQVLAELRQSKEVRFHRGELRPRSWLDYRTRTAKIEEVLGARPISAVTHTELLNWLREIGTNGLGDGPLAPRSVKNYYNVLSELFGEAHKRRYCHENPVKRFTREVLSELFGRKGKRAKINVLSIEEAQQLLIAARDNPNLALLPSVILRLFCGCRTEEIVRLDWHDVRWQDAQPYVHISEDKAKGRAARNIAIPANAQEWLALCPVKAGPVSPRKDSPGYCKTFRRLLKLGGFGTTDEKTKKWTSSWETNDTRHSFGSYHFAAHGNSIQTATEMGHKQGDSVLFNNYRRLTTKAEGQRYFALTPDMKPAGVIDIAEGARSATA